MNDWQDRKSRDWPIIGNYYINHKCDLSSFTSDQLQDEITKRKDAAAQAACLEQERARHNAPILAEMDKIRAQLVELNLRLK